MTTSCAGRADLGTGLIKGRVKMPAVCTVVQMMCQQHALSATCYQDGYRYSLALATLWLCSF